MADQYPFTNIPIEVGTNTSQISAVTNQAESFTRDTTSVSPFTVNTNNFTKKSFYNDIYNSDISGERLYTIRPRSATTFDVPTGEVGHYTQERGQIASMRLLSPSGGRSNNNQEITKEINSLSNGTYNRFFLTDVSVSYNEKVQIMTTFGDGEVAYYFGRQPVVFTLSGIVFDSIDNDWFSKLILLYDSTLRGSQLAKNFELLEVVLPNMKIKGSIMALSHQQSSQRDTEIIFSLQFLAKEVTPISIQPRIGANQNILASLLDFSIGKEGVGGWGYSLSMGTSSAGGFADEIISGVNDALSGIGSVGSDFGSTLNTFRSSIFNPVYGIISSITKIVSSSGGNLSGIISSFSNPVNAILRDIQNISGKAIALSNLIETSANDLLGVPDRMVSNLQRTLHSLKNAAGVISRVPENVAEALKRSVAGGRVKHGAAILSSGKARNKSKAAVLSSGKPYSVSKAYTI